MTDPKGCFAHDCADCKKRDAEIERLNTYNTRLEVYNNRLIEQRDALQARLAAMEKQEPVAYRYDYDGYGYKFIDNGSGSSWAERGKASNGEPLYAAPVAQPEPTLKWCEQCGEGVTDFCRGKGDAKCGFGFGKAGEKQPAEPVEPIGEVESAVFGATGFHVYLYPNQHMPKVGDKLFQSAAKEKS
jgi:hypothetical protein